MAPLGTVPAAPAEEELPALDVVVTTLGPFPEGELEPPDGPLAVDDGVETLRLCRPTRPTGPVTMSRILLILPISFCSVSLRH